MSYSEELTQEIINEYMAEPTRETVDKIATRIGKSTRSVIAKLAAARVYQTPKRTSKTGEAIIKKEELVSQIGSWLNIEVPTLVKTGKLDLKKLYIAIAKHLEIELEPENGPELETGNMDCR